MHRFVLRVSISLVFIVISMGLSHTFANSKADNQTRKPWDKWSAYSPHSKKQIDHKPWQAFLDKYLIQGRERLTRINYAAVTQRDKAALNHYINQLEKVKPQRYNRREQLCFWVNLHNACVIKTILEHYPIHSLKDLPGFHAHTPRDPWHRTIVVIDNTPVSLHDMRHNILLPIWKDPRLHYVLNKGTIGSPNLPARALVPDAIETILNLAAKEFVNSPRGVQVIESRLVTSDIYRKYQSDFGGNEKAVLEHIRTYAHPVLASQILNNHQIDKTFYNWHLNDVHHHAYVQGDDMA